MELSDQLVRLRRPFEPADAPATHPENLASQRVAEKAGFVREGVLRSHIRFRDGRRDSVLFSLLRSHLG